MQNVLIVHPGSGTVMSASECYFVVKINCHETDDDLVQWVAANEGHLRSALEERVS
jgi:hypothetical protein